MSALHNELKSMKRKHQRKKVVNLAVIRISQDGELMNSQPCYHCATELMKNKLIIIKDLYFSNANGMIEKHDFATWYGHAEHHITHGWSCVR